MAKASLQKRITLYSAVIGTSFALLVLIADATSLLRPLEMWLYDLRARQCQFFQPAPSRDVVHVLIDDDAIEAIGAWPWRRSTVAAILDEMRLASPKVVALDVLFTDPQGQSIRQTPFGDYVAVDEDAAMLEAVRRLNRVVLAVSFGMAVPDSQARDKAVTEAAVVELVRDPWRSAAEVARQLASEGFSDKHVVSRIEIDYPDLIREAMLRIVRKRLEERDTTADELWLSLTRSAGSPPTSAAMQPSDPRTARLKSVFDHAYTRARAELALRRFALPAPPGLRAPPPDATIKLAPLSQLSDAAVGCGFVEFDMFDESTVRTVPMFLRARDTLYPQFGLEVACRMLDVDASAVRVFDNAIIIPAAAGDLRIPVRQQYSSPAGRDIGLLMDIPFFGAGEWKTMYDWPAQEKVAQHISINLVWDIVDARAKLASNNVLIDSSLNTLLSPTQRRAYDNRKLPQEDFASRAQVSRDALAGLEFAMELLFNTPDADLRPQDREQRDAIIVLRRCVEENESLAERIERKRKELASLIGNKAVLIGWAATGTLDEVPTSLHARCPGVAVHGVIVNAILNRDFLRTAPRWATILLALMFGLLSTAITARLPPWRAVATLLGVAALYFVANGLLFFDWLNHIVNAAAPLVAIAVCWAGTLVTRVVLEIRERNRLRQEAALLDHEIALARQVQAALIPKQLSILTTVESHGWTLAATTTGGDCFDLWKLADGRLGILVADASGHGLGPSIIVSEVRALVRALCDLYTEPQQLLERVNQRIAADLQGTKFCTCFVGFLSETGTLSWGSAGHGPMLVAATRDQPPVELEGTALPLGVCEEWMGEPSVPPIQLEPGGWLAAFSDGIFEQPDPRGEQFGVERVRKAIDDSRALSCEKIVEAVRTAVHRWQVVPDAVDDQTVVFVRVLDPAGANGNGQTSQPAAASHGGLMSA
jgi:serine phosphatase RsbU (regulator of sigma subunit)/CHASE2 domain-containing sensor protein